MDIRKKSDLQKAIERNAYPEDMRELLRQEAELLKKYLWEEIVDYYGSYMPKQYRRTWRFINSLRVSPTTISKRGNQYMVEVNIYFDQEYANHPSVFGQEDGFVPILINQGWSLKESFQPRIPRFTDYEGSFFIQRAISRFKRDSKIKGLKIVVKAQHNGVKVDGLDGEY